MHVRPWVQPCLEKCPQKVCRNSDGFAEVQTLPTLDFTRRAEASSGLANVQRLGPSTGSALPPGSPPAATAALLGATAAPRRRAAAPPRSPPDAPDALSARRAQHHANPWVTQPIRVFNQARGWKLGMRTAVRSTWVSTSCGDSGPTRYDLPQSCVATALRKYGSKGKRRDRNRCYEDETQSVFEIITQPMARFLELNFRLSRATLPLLEVRAPYNPDTR